MGYSDKNKDGAIDRLKRRVKKLEKENDRLKKEINTLEAYKNITNKYIDDELDGVPVEKVIRSVEKHHNLDSTLQEHKPGCPHCTNKELKIMPILNGELQLCGTCGFQKKVVKK